MTVLIQPLDLADFDPSILPADPGFAGLFSSEVGDTGGPADGFDDVVGELAAFVDALDSALALLSGQEGGHLDEVFAEVAELDPQPVAENAAEFAAASAGNAADVDDLGQFLGQVTPVKPPPPPPPPGGGGPPARAFPVCNLTQFAPPRVAQYPLTIEGMFGNDTDKPVKVKSKKVTQLNAGEFTVTDTIPATMAPHTFYKIDYTQHAGGQEGDWVKIEVAVEGGTFTACLVLTISPPEGGLEPPPCNSLLTCGIMIRE